MLRVLRPGGRIGLANWTPEGFIGRLFKVIGAHVPPPAGLKSPALWGTEAHLAELFGARADSLRAAVLQLPLPLGGALGAGVPRLLRPDAQGLRGARRAGPAGARATTSPRCSKQMNTAGAASLVVPAEYLEVVINKWKEMTMKNLLLTLSATLAFGTLAAPVALAQSSGHAGMASDHMMVTSDELKWVDVPSLPPGAKLAVIEGPLNQAVPVTFRVKLPANYQLPAHWHPAIEHVTVISGTFNMGMGDQAGPCKDESSDRGWSCDHAAEDQSLRLDQGRDDRSGARNGSMGGDLRESGGRPTQAIAISGARSFSPSVPFTTAPASRHPPASPRRGSGPQPPSTGTRTGHRSAQG